jgi:predicted metal-binding membrane protein
MEGSGGQVPSALERVIRRDRVWLAVGLSTTIILAWIYLVRMAADMNAMAIEMQMHAAMGMTDMRSWGAADWAGLFVMWAVMMVAMMLPSAAPVTLLVLSVYRRRGDPRSRASAVVFVGGYVLAWTAFSAAASAGQVGLHRAALMADDMRLGPAAISGVILLLAGVYQWLPVKNTCLTHCQSPLGFLSRYWREGLTGALAMGVRHGLVCVGCCWLLMALLFIVGVMNLFWVAGLAALVLIEKVAPGGTALGRLAGIAIAAWGLFLLVRL